MPLTGFCTGEGRVEKERESGIRIIKGRKMKFVCMQQASRARGSGFFKNVSLLSYSAAKRSSMFHKTVKNSEEQFQTEVATASDNRLRSRAFIVRFQSQST